jgi:pimeloyl-ACP methyl ester carboxylesterase
VSASLEAHAGIITKLIQKLELDRPLLVGHSMGGAVSIAVALDHPELVRGLVLIAPFTQVEHEPPEVLKPLLIRSPVLRQAIAWTVATPLAIINKDATLASLFGPEQPVKDFGTNGGALLGLRPQSFISASEDIVAIEEQFEYMNAMVSRYPSMQTPTWILYGKGDRILDYRKHGELTASQIPEARLDLVEGGHMLPLTMPERAADIIRQTMAAT